MVEPDGTALLLPMNESDDVIIGPAQDLASIVLQSNYPALIHFLKFVDVDPNLELDFQLESMTGLEFSLMSGDWKMACIFLDFGADPAKNCFNGCIQTDVGVRIYHGFDGKTRIPGLDGLAALAVSKEAATFVHLLGVCLEPEGQPHDLLQATLSWLNSLDSNYQTALLKRLYTVALLCLRNNLPQAVSYAILIELVRMELWSYFTDTVVSSLVA